LIEKKFNIKNMKWQGGIEKFQNLIKFTESKNFNFSQLDYIYLSIGITEGGLCWYPHKERKLFHITCRISNQETYPKEHYWFIRPTFFNGQLDHKNYDKEIVNDIEENMSWLLGHELYHFLRKTKQISGYNTQSQGNEFGFKFIREFKEWKKNNCLIKV